MLEGGAVHPCVEARFTPHVSLGDTTREYRVLRLKNGLRALLIHDAAADKAAACLSVNIGHLTAPLSSRGSPTSWNI